MKILVLTADANTLVYHRGDLIRDFAAHGCEVVTSAAEDYPHVHEFVASFGGKSSRHPHGALQDQSAGSRTMWDMWRLFRSEKPDALFAYTIKIRRLWLRDRTPGRHSPRLRIAARPGLHVRQTGDVEAENSRLHLRSLAPLRLEACGCHLHAESRRFEAVHRHEHAARRCSRACHRRFRREHG
jgi:hypothetical protein